MNIIKKDYDKKLFCVAALLIFGGYLFYYWKMAGVFTDIMAHEWIARTIYTEEPVGPLQALAYPLYHVTLHGVAILFGDNYTMAAAVLLSVSNVIIIVLFRWILHQFLDNRTVKQNYLIDFVCITSIIFIDIIGPLTQGRFYQGQCAPNPLQNPTTIFMKPFAILTFYFFVRSYQRLWIKTARWQYEAGYAIFLLLSVLAKPSGAFVMLPAFAVMTIILMIYKKSIRPGIRIFFGTLPSILVLIWQLFFYVMDRISFFEFWFDRVFQPLRAYAEESITSENIISPPVLAGTGSGFQISFGSFYGFNILQVAAVTIAACLVPVLALVCLKKKRKWAERLPLLTAMLVLAVGWGEMFFLTNGGSGDFSWGYGFAVQITTVLGLGYIWTSEQKKWIRWTSAAVYCYQVVCGIVYIVLTYQREAFWF